ERQVVRDLTERAAAVNRVISRNFAGRCIADKAQVQSTDARKAADVVILRGGRERRGGAALLVLELQYVAAAGAHRRELDEVVLVRPEVDSALVIGCVEKSQRPDEPRRDCEAAADSPIKLRLEAIDQRVICSAG